MSHQADADAGYVDQAQVGQRKYSLGDTAQWHVPKNIADAQVDPQALAARKGYVVWLPNARNAQNKHFPSLSKYNCATRPIPGTKNDPNIASTRPFIV